MMTPLWSTSETIGWTSTWFLLSVSGYEPMTRSMASEIALSSPTGTSRILSKRPALDSSHVSSASALDLTMTVDSSNASAMAVRTASGSVCHSSTVNVCCQGLCSIRPSTGACGVYWPSYQGQIETDLQRFQVRPSDHQHQ